MFGRFGRFAGLFLVCLTGQALASTISIGYTLNQVSGNVYDYVYSVFNNGTLPAGGPVQLFDISFDPNLYSNLQIVTPSSFQSQWYEQILPAGGGLPALYDVCATPLGNPTCPTTSGVTSGNTLTGFSVQFNWLGTGLPGSQPFEIDNANNPSQKLETGVTGPEPSSIFLAAFGLALAGYKIRRGRDRSPTPGHRKDLLHKDLLHDHLAL
jgi:hypothetical protein